ncbi:MAG: ATP-binding protein, partial [Phormidesmis sp.]
GRSLLNFSELSLSELSNTVVCKHQEPAKKRGITFALDSKIEPGSDAFRADASRLQQIISNLLHNAIKFTPAGGQVTLRVWREPQTAVFQIEDTGIGIPESQRDILFETFKQLESPFQRQYSGTGLGLAMTKRLVELHSGSIQVESQVGQGSTFTVRLPVQGEPAVPSRYQVPATLEDTAKRVVLLETDADNAAIIYETLTAAGYKVIWLAEPGRLAAQLEELRPVMLIADLALLGSDPDKIKAIQLSIAALNAKVLALMNKKASALFPLAHHDILRKPIDPKTLLKKVRQLMAIGS